MPKSAPEIHDAVVADLAALGAAVRQRRKALGVNALTAAEAAGISRVTLHRIEKGEPSVTIGAYAAVFAALGLRAQALPAEAPVAPQEAVVAARKGWIPARVRIADYPRLKELAWQVHGVDTLRPREALDIYERNARHLDMDAFLPHERDLIEALRQGLAT